MTTEQRDYIKVPRFKRDGRQARALDVEYDDYQFYDREDYERLLKAYEDLQKQVNSLIEQLKEAQESLAREKKESEKWHASAVRAVEILHQRKTKKVK